ncbi:MAG: 4-alpha-glucanotransferase [Clostridia bacterium]|nr:4-alpha-glucanotransferase [Clostridia bacterium]
MLLKDKGNKKSGVLLHLSSLPSKHGIGSLGEEAYKFVDFLKKSGQSYWQMLPLVPIGEGNSPYKSTSCYAGEILYIDLDLLIKEGLLSAEDVPKTQFGDNVDFELVKSFKIPIIKKATQNFDTNRKDYKKFLQDNQEWINDYALYMAICEKKGSVSIKSFDDNLKYRIPDSLKRFQEENADSIRFYKISQYFFYAQYYELKRYAEKSGIGFIGDIPFYVSLDSAEVWKYPDSFLLCRDFTPKCVAGVPPDIFSSTGQLWGNPVYDWEYLKQNGYFWWKKRLAHYSRMYDVVRIDHFRAFADYYIIPEGAENACIGEWKIGAGIDFWNQVRQDLGQIQIIAEDLGGDTEIVQNLVKETGFPNMKVLQFGFSGDPNNPHLPQNFIENCVCYTGTHDNDTTVGWYNSLEGYSKHMADQLFPQDATLPLPFNFIAAALKSKAKLVIIPMQDLLALDSRSRMNTPGTAKGNWIWRMKENAIDNALVEKLKSLSYERN